MKAHIEQALALLDQMDDRITEHGGDEDEGGRRDLAPIRRAKDHLRKCLAPVATFETTDGYKFTLAGGQWSNGDMTTGPEIPWPVDSHGEPLEGRISAKHFQVTHSCGHVGTLEMGSVNPDGLEWIINIERATRCGACRRAAVRYRPGFVSICDSPAFPCYLSSETWNGWAMPFFTREQLPAYMEWQRSVGFHLVEFQENIDSVVTMENKDESEAWGAEDIEIGWLTLHTYPVGTGSWTWEEVDGPSPATS